MMDISELNTILNDLMIDAEGDLLEVVIDDLLNEELTTVSEVIAYLNDIHEQGKDSRLIYSLDIAELFQFYSADIMEKAILWDVELKDFDDIEHFLNVLVRMAYECEAWCLSKFIQEELLTEEMEN